MSGWGPQVAAYTAHLRAAGVAPATIRLRSYWLRRADTDLPPLAAVTHADVVGWMSDHTWGPNTRRSVRAALCSFFRWAVEEGVLSVDASARLPRVRVPVALPRPLDESTFRVAVAAAGPRDRLMLQLAGWCGLRRGEIARVHADDVTECGLVVRGKGGRVRLVPLPADVRAELPTAGWAFPGRWSGHMHPDSVSSAMRRALGGASGPHRLRHRFATRAYAGTHDLLSVQVLLGHSSPATTQVYVAVCDSALAAAVAAAA